MEVDPPDEEVLIICEECGSQVLIEKMAKHQLEKHDKRVFNCTICPASVIGAKAFYQHKVCCQAQALGQSPSPNHTYIHKIIHT